MLSKGSYQRAYHCLYHSHLGYGAIVFQYPPFMVKRILLPQPSRTSTEKTLVTIGSRKAKAVPEAVRLRKDLQDFFKGSPLKTPWACLDVSGVTELEQVVLREVFAVPFGEVRTYGGIAKRVRRPRAARFIGATMARNPLPIVIPCHRIVRADGSLGGFAGGTALKRRLLDLEAKAGKKAFPAFLS